MKIQQNRRAFLPGLNLVFTITTVYLLNLTTITHAAPALRFAPTGGIITSEFGWRTDPFNQSKRFHAGLDIAAPTGTPVFAPEKATVFYSGNY